MKRKVINILLLILIGLLVLAAPVLAYTYYASIAVTEVGGTAYTHLPVIVKNNNSYMATQGYITASGLDTRIGNLSAVYRPHMLATDRTAFGIESAGVGSQTNAYYLAGETALAAFDLIAGYGKPYFSGYVDISDAVTPEPGDDFILDYKGWVNPTAWGYVLRKDQATAITTDSGIIAAGMGAETAEVDAIVHDSASSAYGVNWFAQTFLTGANDIIVSSVLLRLSSNNPGGNIEVAIRATSGGSPTGSDLAVGYLDATTVGAALADYTIPLTVRLESATTYALVVRFVPGTAVNNLNVRYDSAAGYANGEWFSSTDSGATWAGTGFDAYFRVSKFPRYVAVAGLTAGTHRAVSSADTVNLTLDVYDSAGALEGTNAVALVGATVTLIASNWIVMSNTASSADWYKYTTPSAGAEVIEYQPAAMIAESATAASISYPYIVSYSSGTTVAGTSHTVAMPAPVGTGNLLVAIIGTSGAPTITWPTGWTSLFATSQAANNTLAAAYKVATGGETSISVTTSTAQTSSYQVLKIAGYTGVPIVGTAATGAGAANPDPPSLTTGFGAVNTLWLGVATDSVNVTVPSANYGLNAIVGTTPYLVVEHRRAAAATENPGVMTAAAGNWVAQTVGIQTDFNGVVPDLDGGDQNGRLVWGYNPVKTVIGSLTSAAQPAVGATATPAPQDLLPSNASDWHQDPAVGGSLLTNPLRPFVTMLSDNSELTEVQSWRYLGLAFVLVVTVGAAKAVRQHLLIAGIACTGAIVALVAMTIWPTWTLVFAGGAILSGIIAERTPYV